jgi:hypothetical protein
VRREHAEARVAAVRRLPGEEAEAEGRVVKRTPLLRRTPLRRRRIRVRRDVKSSWEPPRIPVDEAYAVFLRDDGCIAAKYDPSHVCFGRLTLAHVPELGQNALGKKPPDDRYHLVAECLGANSGGLQPWSEMHRDIERRHLSKHYPDRYRREEA